MLKIMKCVKKRDGGRGWGSNECRRWRWGLRWEEEKEREKEKKKINFSNGRGVREEYSNDSEDIKSSRIEWKNRDLNKGLKYSKKKETI